MTHSTRGVPVASIIIPTYNERDRLGELVAAIVAACEPHVDVELVVVDDNSPDGTGALADELARTCRMRVLHRSGKLGLGTAVIEGFSAASAPVVGVMDADLSHPPALVPAMLAVMRQANADVVIASRYIPGGGTSRWPLARLLMSRAACLMARGLTPVTDVTSGFFFIRKQVVRDVQIAAGGFKICLELLVRGAPGSIVEVPYVFEGRTLGESKMNLKEALGYLVQLRDLHRFQRAHRTPRPAYTRVSAEQLRTVRP